MDLSKYAKPKIDEWREILNLTEQEEVVFNMLAKGHTIIEISEKTTLSERTVSRRIMSISNKMEQICKEGE